MSLLQLNLTNVKEPAAVPEGQYLLRVTAAELGKSKSSGADQLSVTFAIENTPNARAVYEYYGLPSSDDTEDKANQKLLKFKRLFDAMGIDSSSGVDTTQLIGKSAWAVLSYREEEGYEPSNRIRRFVGKN